MPFAAAQKSCELPASDASAAGATLRTKHARTFAWMALDVAVSFLYLYTSLFSVTGIPHLRSGDEGFFWTYAARLLDGQVFLKDFHQFTPPGTDLVYAAVFRTLTPAYGAPTGPSSASVARWRWCVSRWRGASWILVRPPLPASLA